MNEKSVRLPSDLRNIYNIFDSCHFGKEVSKIISSYENREDSLILLPSYSLSHEISQELIGLKNERFILLPDFLSFKDIPNNLYRFLPFSNKLDISRFNCINKQTLKFLLTKDNPNIRITPKFMEKNSESELFITTAANAGFILESEMHKLALNRLESAMNEKSDIPIFIIVPYGCDQKETDYIKFLMTLRNAVLFIQSGCGIGNGLFIEKIRQYDVYIKNRLEIAGTPEKIYCDSAKINPYFLESKDEFNACKLAFLIVHESLTTKKTNNNIAIVCKDRQIARFIENYFSNYNLQVKNLFNKCLSDTLEFDYFRLLAKFAAFRKPELFLEIINHLLSDLRVTEKFEDEFLRGKFYYSIENLLETLPDNSRIKDEFAELLSLFDRDDYKSIITRHIKIFFATCKLDIIDSKAKSVLNNYLKFLENPKIHQAEITVDIDFKIGSFSYLELLNNIAADFIIKESVCGEIEVCNLLQTNNKTYDTVILFDDNINTKNDNLIDDLSPYRQVQNLSKANLYFVFINSIDDKEQMPSSLYSILKSDYPNNSITDKYYCRLSELNDITYCPSSRPKPSLDFRIRPSSYSVSAIEKLFYDPYSYYAEYILKLRKKSEFFEFKAEKEFGIFIHEVLNNLKDFYLAGKDTLSQLIEDVSSKYFDVKSIDPISKIIWFKRAKCIINELSGLYKENGPIRIWSEIKGEVKIYFDLFDNETVNEAKYIVIKAGADRIEKFENFYKIIDYKTGMLPTKKNIVSGKAPQLSIEKYIMENSGFPMISIVNDKNILTELTQLLGRRKVINRLEVKLSTKDIENILKDVLIEFIKSSHYVASLERDISGKIANYRHLRRKQEWFDSV
jgi:RecB family exonuclease